MGRPRVVVANAFSVNMVPNGADLSIVRVTPEVAREVIDRAVENGFEVVSIVGHESTAKLISQMLGHEVGVNRVNYVMMPEDVIIAVVVGTRLPEGKVLNDKEIQEMLEKDLIRLYLIHQTPPCGTQTEINKLTPHTPKCTE